VTTLVVVGMKSEANIVSTMPDTVVVIGAGAAIQLTADIEAAIAGGCDHVLSFGTCGALAPDLVAGQLVVGTLIEDAPNLDIDCDETWAASIEAATGATPVSVTTAATTVATVAEKATLFASSHADVVDLESCVAARVAKAHNLPFAVLRAVSDAADQDIPPAALAALTATGNIDVGAIIASLTIDDDQIPALLKLADTSALAFNALAQALADLGINYGEC
jgi:nucleoside phosphorylase